MESSTHVNDNAQSHEQVESELSCTIFTNSGVHTLIDDKISNKKFIEWE